MDRVKTMFVQPIEKPARKALIKRGVRAEDYYQYCEEVGCDIWGLLLSIPGTLGETMSGCGLPRHLIASGTSKYVQGVEVPQDYTGPLPDGLDMIDLPAATYLMFRGEPYAEDDYEQAIDEVWEAMKKYDPALAGYAWDDQNPRIQLASRSAAAAIWNWLRFKSGNVCGIRFNDAGTQLTKQADTCKDRFASRRAGPLYRGFLLTKQTENYPMKGPLSHYAKYGKISHVGLSTCWTE